METMDQNSTQFRIKTFFLGHHQNKTAVKTSVANVRLLMPLAIIMLCFRSKSISVIVVSIMNFTSKLAYLYKLTEKKRLNYLHASIVVQDLKKEEN